MGQGAKDWLTAMNWGEVIKKNEALPGKKRETLTWEIKTSGLSRQKYSTPGIKKKKEFRVKDPNSLHKKRPGIKNNSPSGKHGKGAQRNPVE